MFHIRPRGYVPVGAPPSGPASLVQTIGSTPAEVSEGSATFAAPVQAGNSIVCCVIMSQSGKGSNAISTIIDDQTQSYTEFVAGRGSLTGGFSWAAHIWDFHGSAAGVQEVTVTLPADIWFSIVLYELTAAARDVSAFRVQESSAPIQCADDPGITTTGGAFGIGVCTTNNVTWSTPTGWTQAWQPDGYEFSCYREEPTQFVNEVCDVSADNLFHAACLGTYVAA